MGDLPFRAVHDGFEYRRAPYWNESSLGISARSASRRNLGREQFEQ